MTIFYFTNPDNKERIAKVVTNHDAAELQNLNIFKSTTAYIEREESEEDHPDFPTNEEEVKYFDCLKFDDQQHPTKLIIDLESAKSLWLEDIRWERNRLLERTDYYMMKSIGMGIKSLQTVIEKDKSKLRDLTDKINFAKIKTIHNLEQLHPPILDIDYEYKYDELIKKHKTRKTHKSSTAD